MGGFGNLFHPPPPPPPLNRVVVTMVKARDANPPPRHAPGHPLFQFDESSYIVMRL